MTSLSLPVIKLKKNRESSLLRRHPWIFSGGIQTEDAGIGSGDVVQVVDSKNKFIGVGGYSPVSQIRVRILSFEDEVIDKDFFAARLERALAKRAALLSNPLRNACRLVYGESDHIPGLVVDKYADFLVCQFLFAGLESWKQDIVALLAALTGCKGIYERSDANSRTKEGLDQTTGVLWGEPPPTTIQINENGMLFNVDVVEGQKTGFFLDQVHNRHYLRDHCADKNVLNCFSYTGGFTIAALQSGASHVTSIDSSAPAMALLGSNLTLNAVDETRHTSITGNVFHVLRDFQAQEKHFDVIVLDPPKFAENKNQVMKAARAYKDLSLQACRVLNPGGLLLTYSCSGAIDMNLFQKITSDALLDAGRQGDVVRYLHQGEDHPIALEFPESQYLKGVACRVY
ncbi:MAG: 23S rRNA (cytosine1962-C5)-methyltransferase [Pseudohongiellaceae bacterium]|jgi:23S rRNA (cytosine1962-C5)-methyltransferase